MNKSHITIPKKTLEYIIDGYTRESGVRQLDKQISKLMRVTAKYLAFEEPYSKNMTISKVNSILGPARYLKDKYAGNTFAGVVTGLAWTATGGEILLFETSLSKGDGKLTLTGNLGDVMKESAVIALEYLKAHSGTLNLDPKVFQSWNVHLHVPEGAIPKDGPSAGVSMLTSIASAFTQRKVRPQLAMTGEITLRGKILPVGGIKEKILAAKRAGINYIAISGENLKDVEEIPEIYRNGLTFKYMDNVGELLKFALLNEKVQDPLILN